MSATEWIAQRRELLDAATEGPWGATYGPRELARVWTDAPDDAEALATITGFTRQADGAPDALLIADARTSLPRALDALEAVLEPHQLQRVPGGQEWCLHCGGDWPCPTVTAIESALRAES